MNNVPALGGDDELIARARPRVARKTRFYVHVVVFVLVNGGLYLFGQSVGSPRWPMFPFWGWASPSTAS